MYTEGRKCGGSGSYEFVWIEKQICQIGLKYTESDTDADVDVSLEAVMGKQKTYETYRGFVVICGK